MVESQLIIDADFTEPASIETDHLSIAYFFRRSPTASVTEDSGGLCLRASTGEIFAIADGMGGHPCGEEASRLAVSTIIAGLGGNSQGYDNPLRYFDDANQRVIDLKKGSGSTIVVAELRGNKVRFYNVGDSLGLVLGGKGKIKCQTVQHTKFGYGVESGLIKNTQTNNHRYGSELNNYLGSPSMRVDVGIEFTLASQDMVLLMSDGLYDHVDFTAIRPAGSCLEFCQSIVAEAIRNMESTSGRHDDMSIILFQIKKC